MARPTKLTPQLIDDFAAALRKNFFLSAAADVVGISYPSVSSWMRQGKAKPQSIHGAFLAAVKAALADVHGHHVEFIASRATGWQASAWLLERRWPERWSSYKGEVKELRRLLAEVLRGSAPPPAA